MSLASASGNVIAVATATHMFCLEVQGEGEGWQQQQQQQQQQQDERGGGAKGALALCVVSSVELRDQVSALHVCCFGGGGKGEGGLRDVAVVMGFWLRNQVCIFVCVCACVRKRE